MWYGYAHGGDLTFLTAARASKLKGIQLLVS
jgi:hypothetical protein